MSIKIEGYEIIEKAGGTTDTTIWTARQISLDRNVSIWVMKARAAADTNLVNHFQAITRAISRLKHNNFPPVIDISTTPDGIPYIVFENAESTSITRIIKQRGVYAYHDALRIAKEVALALDTAWKQTGLVHRNLKPDNIRISDDGNIKIFNFNSATIVQPGTNPLAFDDGMVVGTPNYAAPEQIDCLPSIESNNLKETIMTKFIKFQHGFEASKPYITANIRSLVKVTAKEFYYDLEDYVWSADAEETLELSRKLFDIMNAYKAFGELHPVILDWENHIRRFMPRCYAKLGEYDKAAGQLMIIIQNCRDIFNGEEALEHAKEEIGFALEYLDECHKEKLACCKDYQQAMEIISG